MVVSPDAFFSTVAADGVPLATENGSHALGGESLWFGSLPAT